MTDIGRAALAITASVFLLAASLEAQSPVVPITPIMPTSHQVNLATLRSIFIASHTEFVKQAEIEKAFFQRKEFGELGVVLTRDARSADVTLEVRRVPFRTHFPYSVYDNRTKTVLTAGEVNSIGGSAHGRIAAELVMRIKAARGNQDGSRN
jgi:hypothetical protein